jgi:hypothetical protein
LHLAERTEHTVYHISSGIDAPTYREITDTICALQDRRPPFYAPGLAAPVRGLAAVGQRVGTPTSRRIASLLGVFLPYLTYNTVFDNTRAVKETGSAPAAFTGWGTKLLEWSRHHRFEYPYLPWPEENRKRPPAAARVTRAETADTTGSPAA